MVTKQLSSRVCRQASMADIYPFPEEDPDFKLNPPNTPQRFWLAKRIVDGVDSGPALATRFNSSSHFMRILAYKYRKGYGMKHCGGRPRALDKASVSSLQQFVTHDDDVYTNEFRDLLNEEYAQSLARRRPRVYLQQSESRGVRVMPRRTRKRYISYVSMLEFE
jgi:transposase